MVASLVPRASQGCLALAKSTQNNSPSRWPAVSIFWVLAGQRPAEQARTEPTCPRLSFRKTMLNDLLRFDVKDCSWCRWVAS